MLRSDLPSQVREKVYQSPKIVYALHHRVRPRRERSLTVPQDFVPEVHLLPQTTTTNGDAMESGVAAQRGLLPLN